MRAELSTAPIFTSGDGEVPYDAIGNWNNTISPLLHRYCQMTSSVTKTDSKFNHRRSYQRALH